MRQKIVNLYEYHELSAKAKQRAAEWYISCLDEMDYDMVEEDAKEIAGYLGFTVKHLYWSGFSRQGDGACIVGHWDSRNVDVAKLREYAPIDSVLHGICDKLASFAAQFPDSALHIELNHIGRYSHAHSVSYEFSCDVEFTQEQEKEFESAYVDFMQWIYKRLEEQHDFLHSEENVSEIMEENEYTFTEDGKRED